MTIRLLCLMTSAVPLVATARAGETKAVPLDCARASSELRIDGSLADPSWTRTPPATGFSLLGSGGTRRAFRQTTFRVLHDDKAIYLGIICLEPDPASVVAKVTERDGAVWLEDAVELFLQPNFNSRRFFHFIINANGVYYDAESDNAGWDASITAASKRLDTHWQLEIAIPWASLGQACPPAESEWGFNIAREHRPPDAPEWSTWMPLAKGKKKFALPSHFGRIRFVADTKPAPLSFLDEDGLAANSDFDALDPKGLPKGWRLNSGTTVEEIAPHSGQHAITNASGYFIAGQRLDLPVKAGQFFTAFAIVRGADDAQLGVAVRRERADGVGRDIYPFWKVTASQEYSLHVRPIVIPPDTKRLIEFNLYRANQKGRIWFDYAQVLPGVHGLAILRELAEVFAKDRHPIGDPAPSPHLAFAKPLAGGPIRALCFATRHLREVQELAQRLHLQYDLVHCPSSRGSGGKCVASYCYQTREVIALLDGVGARYDVIVLAAMPSEAELVDKLIAAVAAGTGLVFVEPVKGQRALNPEHWARLKSILPKAALPADAKHWISAGVPDVPLQTLATGTHGGGRIAVLRFSSPTQGLIPSSPGKCRWWEYRYSLLARAAAWAARGEPSVRIDSATIADDRVTATISNPGGQDLTLTGLWDHEKLPEANWLGAPTTKELGPARTLHVDLPVPQPVRVTAGRHIATLVVRDPSGATLDWASVATDTTPSCRLKSVKLDKEAYRPGDRPAADIDIVMEGPPPLLSLSARLVDAFGRVIAKASQDLDMAKATTSRRISVEIRSPLAVYHRLQVDLMGADGVLDRLSADVLVPTVKASALDDFQLAAGYTAIPFSPPSYLQGAAAGFMRSSGFTCIMPDQAAVRHGMLGFRSSVSRTAHMYRDAAHVRKPCFNNPTNLQEAVDSTVKGIAAHRGWGFIGYTMWDETHLSQQESTEVCVCDHCKKAFQQWLRQHHRTVEHLNAAWGAKLASWQEAAPVLLEDAAARTRNDKLPNLAQWVDFRRFMEHGWLSMVAEVQSAIKDRWPEVRLSFTNPYKFGPLSGTNQWLMSQTEDILLKYFKAANTPRYRSYTSAPMVSWFGYQSSADACRRYVWWFALNGGVMPIWWDPLEPWEYGGNRGLVAWNVFDPLWRATGRSKAVAESAADLLNGFGKLLRTAHRAQAKVAILHSQESMHLAYALDAVQPKGRRCLYKGWKQSDGAWRSLLEQNGIPYDYIAADELRGDDPGFKWRTKIPGRPRTGLAALEGYRVLILPDTLALSDRATKTIGQFTAKGGWVVADVLPGIADEHGTPTPGSRSALFGVSYNGLPRPWQPDDLLTFTDLTLKPLAGDGVPSQVQALAQDDAQAMALTQQAGALLFARQHAKGRAICLGFLPPTTPEAAALVAHLLAPAHVTSPFVATTADGSPAHDVETYVYELGHARFVAIVRDAKAEPDTASYHVSWPTPAHTYHSRAKRYLGHVKTAELAIPKAETAFLALMPYAIRAVRVQASDVRAGARLPVTVSIAADEARVGDHVIHLDLRDPDGVAPPAYRWNVVAKAGHVSLDLPTAINDPHGRWTLGATDVASGATGQVKFSLQP